MIEIKKAVQQTLCQNRYDVDFTMNQCVFHRKGWDIPVTLSLPLALGIILIGFYANYHFALLGILLLGIPLINDSWKFPKKIDFDYHNNVLIITKGLFRKLEIDYKDIEKIIIKNTVQRGQVSRFEEGNRDFFYKFYVEYNGKSSRLLSIKTRKDIMPQMEELRSLLNFSAKISYH